MSGTFPTSPSFTTTNFKINSPVQTSQTFGGRIRRVGMGTSYYTFTVKFPPMTRAQAQPIIGFMAAQFGQLDSFSIYLPVESYPSAAYSGSTPRAQAALATGVRTAQISNITANAKILNAGDYFKFANHDKVYMAVENCTANGSGVATLNFSGGLVNAVPINTNLNVTDVPFKVILNNEVQEYEIGLGKMYAMELDMREVF